MSDKWIWIIIIYVFGQIYRDRQIEKRIKALENKLKEPPLPPLPHEG